MEALVLSIPPLHQANACYKQHIYRTSLYLQQNNKEQYETHPLTPPCTPSVPTSIDTTGTAAAQIQQELLTAHVMTELTRELAASAQQQSPFVE